MNFFESQEHARKQTNWLILLFLLAVIGLLVLSNLLAMFIDTSIVNASQNTIEFDKNIFLVVSTIVLSVIVLASLYKINSLKKGGGAVAEMLGGARITADTNDLDQIKILNVVEEMAIASGTPVPPVYLLDEAGINAFAAGYSSDDAVIGVTRGCITQLNRAELQGVIAHEFSHILNGDMRLNIRLIGVLHGILSIGLIGYFLLRTASYGRHSRSRNDNSAGIMAVAVGLLVIGYTGTFFGNLIKAAVSRQREYLADASAVQFTRNNLGIANALKRIGASSIGSRIENPAGIEISHAFFAEGVGQFFSSIFATHPPLGKRIQRLDPEWNGNFVVERDDAAFDQQDKSKIKENKTHKPAKEQLLGGLAGAGIILKQVGQLDEKMLLQAQALLQNIPPQLRSEIQQPYGARAVIYLLLLDENSAIRCTQLEYLKSESDDGVYDVLEELLVLSASVKTEHRLPLIDMCLPTLRLLSAPQYQRFKNNIKNIIEIDKNISLFEWSLQKIIINNLDANFKNAVPNKTKYNDFKSLTKECSVLLSVLIYVGKKKKIDKDAVMADAGKVLGNNDVTLLPIAKVALDELTRALNKLKQLRPLQKPALLKACVVCISSDQNFSSTEAELFRAIANTLDCPMPAIHI